MVSILHWLIRFYQIALSPLLGPRCRYIPTCSQYALEAVHRYGAIKGSWLAVNRVCRAHIANRWVYSDNAVRAKDSRQFDKIESTNAG